VPSGVALSELNRIVVLPVPAPPDVQKFKVSPGLPERRRGASKRENPELYPFPHGNDPRLGDFHPKAVENGSIRRKQPAMLRIKSFAFNGVELPGVPGFVEGLDGG
jgi:hypothetical protein